MWLFFLALHIAGLTGYNLLLRKSLITHTDHWTAATIMQTGIALPMMFALFIAPPDLAMYTPKIILAIFTTSLLLVALHISNVKSLQYLEAGVYSVLYNLRILFATILGTLFLSEDLILLQVMGGSCIFLAVFAVRQKGKEQATHRGLWWGAITALVVSFLNLGEKALLDNIGYLPFAIPVMLLATVVMWSIMLVRRQKIEFKAFITPNALSLMSFRAVSAYSSTLALYAGATLSAYTYLSGMSVIVTILFGILLLGENDYLKQKLVSAALAGLGLAFILLASR